MNWHGFWKWLSRSLIALALILIGSIWIVDPYDTLPFSPPLERRPMATNQRYSYPAIARNPVFDSAVIGTSTARMLKPDTLNAALDARFANLSMNSATAYEQARLVDVFTRHRAKLRNLIVGLDIAWCKMAPKLEKYTFRRFPEWMYDANPWNDALHMLEFKTFEILGRQVGYLLGLKEARYGYDGYKNFLPPAEKYDLAIARKKIYGPTRATPVSVAAGITPAVKEISAKWTYPSHSVLDDMLKKLPVETRKILVFVPYHRHHQPAPHTRKGAQWHTCKKRISTIADRYPNSVVLDFMIPSPITKRDMNYWDVRHFTTDIADRLVRLIGRGARGESAPDGEYVVLQSEP